MAPAGQLTVVCVPACDEVLDGRSSLGPSPVFQRNVRAGTHHLTLRTTTAERVADIVVSPGEQAIVKKSMIDPS
jgi:hypothetical protein